MENLNSKITLSQPTCWTDWIKAHKRLLSLLGLPPHGHKLLKMRDSRFRYTIVHALMAGDIDEEVVRQIFNILRKISLISLITAKDKEGDTPLHSAIRSGTKPELIQLLMTTVPGVKTKRRLLLEPNKRGELPIVNAFSLRRWPIVEVLLEECIKCQVLPELTGIDFNSSSKTTNTLLVKAMKRGFTDYLDIFLKVCRKSMNTIPMKALLVPDKKGRTAWYHFLSHEVHVVKEGLTHLKKYEVDINKLLCDPTRRVGLLHEAFRRENGDVIDVLINYGARRDQLDADNLSPPQRRRVFSLDSTPTSPVHHASFAITPPMIPSHLTEEIHVELEDVSEQQNSDNSGGVEDEWVHPEQDRSGDEGKSFNDLERAEDVEPVDQVLEDEEESVSESPEEIADSDKRDMSSSTTQDCAKLLDALYLEVPFRSIPLSPRQERTTEISPTLYVAPPQWRSEFHFKCFKFWAVADNHRHLLLLRRASHLSVFAEVDHQWQQFSREPQLCQIILENSPYIIHFNTLSE